MSLPLPTSLDVSSTVVPVNVGWNGGKMYESQPEPSKLVKISTSV